MTFKSFAVCILLFGVFPIAAQENENPLPKGHFNTGYRVITLPYYNPSRAHDTIKLILNLWYPTEQTSGTFMRLLDYLSYHKSTQSRESYDIIVGTETQQFKQFIGNNFGNFEAVHWKSLEQETTSAYLNASYAASPYPLIIGRLRAFSTTYTNEFLASHGYVVCMINGVEDYPPDNRSLYYKQVSNEIDYYAYARSYLQQSLQITTGKSGLMGFSGGGFSQFLAPMNQDIFDAVALLESGIFLDGDLFDIVSHHPYYNPDKFKVPLLFLYNKTKFEKNKASKNFYNLKSQHKYLVLFNDSTQHHWDFATEGIVAALFLHNRDQSVADKQIKNFKTMNEIILKFFNIFLKDRHDLNMDKTNPLIIGVEDQ